MNRTDARKGRFCANKENRYWTTDARKGPHSAPHIPRPYYVRACYPHKSPCCVSVLECFLYDVLRSRMVFFVAAWYNITSSGVSFIFPASLAPSRAMVASKMEERFTCTSGQRLNNASRVASSVVAN